ncbi:MAG TPA: response regulator [Steroidobacteraceae bacterium]|nr:response regulator [Steroidobacteraceae bacterium]
MTKRILFVDDDPEILDGLRTMLRRRRNGWEMEFATSGENAVKQLEQSPFDLLCSDMRMPGMDGAQLLTVAAERWPGTVRIVLSGYAELAQTVRLVPIAHQYLAKPCDAKRLETTLERCLKVQEMLKRPDLRALVGRVKRLPAQPKTFQLLCAAMARKDTTATELANIVASDPVITARILQVVNSAFFRLPRQIGKIREAVSYLGFSAIRNLALSAEVFSASERVPAVAGFNLDVIQLEALKTAAVMRALTKDTMLVDDAFVVGLLHDIGLLVLIEVCPDKLQAAQEKAKQGMPLHLAERECIGASHAEVGAYLLALWGLPYSIVDAVAHQCEPDNVEHAEFDLLAALCISLKMLGDEKQLQHPPLFSIDDNFLKRVSAPFSFADAQQCARNVVLAGEGS